MTRKSSIRKAIEANGVEPFRAPELPRVVFGPIPKPETPPDPVLDALTEIKAISERILAILGERGV